MDEKPYQPPETTELAPLDSQFWTWRKVALVIVLTPVALFVLFVMLYLLDVLVIFLPD